MGPSMQQKSSKTRFWLTLLIVNILAFIYPLGLLFTSEDDGTRLFAVIMLMAGFILLAVTDAVSIVFAHWT